MAIRVAHVGTGNAGRIALTQLIEDPRFELVALCVSTPSKIGKDAGELAGLDVVTGITAVGSIDELIATQPECAVYCAMGDTRPIEAFNDCLQILAAGINIVGTSPVGMLYPYGNMPDKAIAKIDSCAKEADVSIYVSGVDPGFANDLLPFALASTCQKVTQVRCYEIADYATYDGVITMRDMMGFGKPLEETPLLFLPGILGLGWGTTLRILAAGFGVEIDEITAPREIALSLRARGGAPASHTADRIEGVENNMVYEVQRFAALVRGEADATPDQQRTLAVLRAVEAIRGAGG